MVIALENIDFNAWTPTEQQQAYNELAAILGITPGPDLPAMTDAAISQLLKDVAAEMQTRAGAVVSVLDAVELGTDTVFTVRP